MANIGTDETGAGEADLGIHVGAIHVDLAAVLVDELADVADAGFENAVGGRVGDHQRGEIRRVLDGFLGEIIHIDVARFVAFHADHFHADHHGGCRVGAVCRDRDEADIAVGVAAGKVVAADREEAGILALRAGIWLQRNSGETGDFGEPAFEACEHFAIALRLVLRHEGVQ